MEDYENYEIVREGMRVTLEIPRRRQEEEREKQEIRNILTAALRDDIQRYCSERRPE